MANGMLFFFFFENGTFHISCVIVFGHGKPFCDLYFVLLYTKITRCYYTVVRSEKCLKYLVADGEGSSVTY